MGNTNPHVRHLVRYSIHVLFIVQLLVSTNQFASGYRWDGIIITQAEYQALQAFKHDIIDPIGVLRSWNDSGYGACSGKWAGIKCLNGQVIAIHLPWKGLGGRLSEKIGQLQTLRKLSLHDNLLTGTVPWSLGLLPSLRGVYLFNNRLSGTIPPSIGNCPILRSFDVSNNMIQGTIPPSLVNSTRLYRLNVSFNSLSGSLPNSFTQSHSLTILALQHNNVSGSLPNTWGEIKNKTFQLKILTLDHNLVSGSTPTSLGNLVLLEELSLSHNQISGSIPSKLCRLSRLRVLDLSNNVINGSFPDSLSNLSSLVSLNLKNNKFDGKISETIGNISGIIQIDLSGNGFVGTIPDSLTKLANLSSFNVSYNNLSGPVPSLLAKKFNGSSFLGNLQLCGFSPSHSCPSPPPPQKLQAPSLDHRKLSTKDTILIAAAALLVILLVLCFILLRCLIRKKAPSRGKNGNAATMKTSVAARSIEKTSPRTSSEVQAVGAAGGKLVHFDGLLVFTADDLLCAIAEIMGKSAYGTAYKATLEDGNLVLVKRLREKTTKGLKEFESEVATLGKIRHPNLLALRAYYLGPKGEKLLVFDYISKGTLSSFLHARGPEISIDWPTRMKIAMGVTRGLSFLHTDENIVHGNLTSSNILLDDDNNAHIADYGLFRLMTNSANTNIIATAGTLGYNAMELSKTKKPNTKTDVYSLGVIILELLTGKSPGEPTNGMDLPQWVASIVKEEWTNEVFDLELMRDVQVIGDELLNTLKLALHCVDPSLAARPEAQQVLRQLEEIKLELTAAITPGRDEGSKAPPPATQLSLFSTGKDF